MRPQEEFWRLREENARLRAALRKVQDKAYDGQNYDAMHAFNVLLSIHTLTMTVLRGEEDGHAEGR